MAETVVGLRVPLCPGKRVGHGELLGIILLVFGTHGLVVAGGQSVQPLGLIAGEQVMQQVPHSFTSTKVLSLLVTKVRALIVLKCVLYRRPS